MKKSIVVVLSLFLSIPSWSNEIHKNHKEGCSICPPGPAGPAGVDGAAGSAGANGSNADSDGMLAAGYGVNVRMYDAQHFGLGALFTHDVRHDNKSIFGMLNVKIGKSYEEKKIEELKYLLANTQQALEAVRRDVPSYPLYAPALSGDIVNPPHEEPARAVIRGSVK